MNKALLIIMNFSISFGMSAPNWDCILQRDAENDNLDGIKKALDNGANPNGPEESAYPPIHNASYNNNLEAVKLLLSKGVNINAQTISNQTPLAIASIRGHTGLAKFLLEHGADPNIADNEGYTPLHGAVNGADTDEEIEIVKLLLEKGANIDAQTKDSRSRRPNFNGATPLHYAVIHGDAKVTKLLLDKGANKDIKNKADKTAVDLAKTEDIKNLINLY